jgi:Protein of unknown function (DUF732)
MKALARTRKIVWLYSHQPLTIRMLAATAGILTAAAAFAAPAEADQVDDNFIDALNHAGVNFGEPGNAMSMGQSVCSMLAKPGGNIAAAAQQIRGSNGMSSGTAKMFATIAIQMYCPTVLADLASGKMPQVPGMGGIPGMGGGIPGMGGTPGMGGIPGLGGTPATGGIPGLGGTAATGGIPGMGGTAGMPGLPGMPGI